MCTLIGSESQGFSVFVVGKTIIKLGADIVSTITSSYTLDFLIQYKLYCKRVSI